VAGLGVDYAVKVDGLQKFSRELRKANPKLKREFDRLLKQAADGIVTEAKINAGWSERIPGSIRPVIKRGRVAVKAGNAKAPHAAALENKGKGGTFRHPVYGNRAVWVDQEAHPYLGPEIPKHDAEVQAGILSAWDRLKL
jgi:hypothetical protein